MLLRRLGVELLGLEQELLGLLPLALALELLTLGLVLPHPAHHLLVLRLGLLGELLVLVVLEEQIEGGKAGAGGRGRARSLEGSVLVR